MGISFNYQANCRNKLVQKLKMDDKLPSCNLPEKKEEEKEKEEQQQTGNKRLKMKDLKKCAYEERLKLN